jgi:hypothetical protein
LKPEEELIPTFCGQGREVSRLLLFWRGFQVLPVFSAEKTKSSSPHGIYRGILAYAGPVLNFV